MHRHRGVQASDEQQDYDDLCAAVKRYSERARRRAGKRRPRRSGGNALRRSVESAASRYIKALSDAVCDDMGPRYEELEAKACRFEQMSAALHELPAYKSLVQRNKALEKKIKLMESRSESKAYGNEVRLARDGSYYTYSEFCSYYGNWYWNEADRGRLPDPVSLQVTEKRSIADDESVQEDILACSKQENKVIAEGCSAAQRVSGSRTLFSSEPQSDGDSMDLNILNPSVLATCDPEDDIAPTSDEESEVTASDYQQSVSEHEDDDRGLACEDHDIESESESESDVEVVGICLNGNDYYASGLEFDGTGPHGIASSSNGVLYSVCADGDVGDEVGTVVDGKVELYSQEARSA